MAASTVRGAISGSRRRVLVGDLRRVLAGTPSAHPSWSPTGGRLAFVHLAAGPGWGPGDIAVLQVRSRRITVLVDHAQMPAGATGYPFAPDFSPDGASIAWLEAFQDQWGEIWVMAADGASPRQVTSFGHSQVIADLDW